MMTIGVDQVRVRVLPDGRMTRRDAANTNLRRR